MAKLLILRGVPASGKSTYAKAWVDEDPLNRVRVNRDNLRWTMGIKGGIGDHWQEEEVTHWQNEMIARYLNQGMNVVVDNTNLRARHVKELIKLGQKWGAEIEFKDFPIALVVAQARDEVRQERGERYVGRQVIATMFSKFIGKNGELPPVPHVPRSTPLSFKPYVEVPGLPRAILVDIDGTLAHMDDRRGPYETDKYHLDRFDPVVAQIARDWWTMRGEDTWNWNDNHVILMSGRFEDFRTETQQWLDLNDFEYHALYMRASGDERNDAVVKDELFEKYIAGRFNVDFILDDRNRVVEMWRAKGLKVLQVASGDF